MTDLESKISDIKLMDKLLEYSLKGNPVLADFVSEEYVLEIINTGYIQHLIDRVIDFNRIEKIVHVFDAGKIHQSFGSIDIVTDRFVKSGGFMNYYFPSKNRKMKTNIKKIKNNKIFISHSSIDKPIVEKFIDYILILGLGFDEENIFCTSTTGTDVKSGADFKKAIRKELMQCKGVIQIISQNYKNSEVCLNEMGAAWVVCENVIPMLVPNFGYDVGFIHQTTVQLKLNVRENLHKLYDDYKGILFPSKINASKFYKSIDEFIKWVNENYSKDSKLKVVSNKKSAIDSEFPDAVFLPSDEENNTLFMVKGIYARYYISNGYFHEMPNPATASFLGFSKNKVSFIQIEKLDELKKGKRVNDIRKSLIIQNNEDGHCWLMLGKYRHHIPDVATYKKLVSEFNCFKNSRRMTGSEMDKIPMGRDLMSINSIEL